MGESTLYHAAPQWLTQEYVENMLKKYKNNSNITVKCMEIKPAINKGENYASIMTRIKVTFQEGNGKSCTTENYIIKTTHEDDPFIANIMRPYDIYKTEMDMYEKVLPQLSKLLQSIGDKDKLFADTIHVDYKNMAIIFEDLAVTQFEMANRISGMDKLHAKLALKKLAKMHATAAVMNENQQGILEKYTHGIFNKHTKGFAPFFENMLEVCANFAGSCPELGSYYKDKLLKLKPHVMDYAAKLHDYNPEYFHTLIHGDFWINNVMLRYDESKNITDLKLIDFQFCNWANPAIDLHYFFNTSLQNELRLNAQDELIQYYHRVLSETLKDLKYSAKIPSLHEFCIQVEAARFNGKTIYNIFKI